MARVKNMAKEGWRWRKQKVDDLMSAKRVLRLGTWDSLLCKCWHLGEEFA